MPDLQPSSPLFSHSQLEGSSSGTDHHHFPIELTTYKKLIKLINPCLYRIFLFSNLRGESSDSTMQKNFVKGAGKIPVILFFIFGGGEGVRTPDLRLAKPALCQTELHPHSQIPNSRWWA